MVNPARQVFDPNTIPSDWLIINIDPEIEVNWSFTEKKTLLTYITLIIRILKTPIISGKQQTITVKEATDLNSPYASPWGYYNGIEDKIIYISKNGVLSPNEIVGAPSNLPCTIGFDDSNLFLNWFFHTILHVLTCPQIQHNIKNVETDTKEVVEMYIGKHGLNQFKKCLRNLPCVDPSDDSLVDLPESVIENLTGFLVTTSPRGAVHTYYNEDLISISINCIMQPFIVNYTTMPFILQYEQLHPLLLGIFEDNGYIINYGLTFVNATSNDRIVSLWSQNNVCHTNNTCIIGHHCECCS